MWKFRYVVAWLRRSWWPRLLALGFMTCYVLFADFSDSPLAPVSGIVTLDGKPTPDIAVHFQPSADNGADPRFRPGSYGRTDAEGRYTLETAEGAGAIVGEHVVKLVYRGPSRTYDEFLGGASGTEKPRKFKLPPKARDGTLGFVVPQDGSDQANFAFDSREM